MAKGRKGKSGGGRPPRIIPVLLILAALAAAIWYRGVIVAWIADSAAYIWRLLGLGIFLIIIALAILVVLLALRKQSTLVHRWNRWLALASFLAALWGIFGLTSLGGTAGLALVGSQDFLGGLKVAGLVVLGVVFAAPFWSFRMAKKGAAETRRYSPLYKWYRFLGAVALILGIWGILAFAGAGGGFGAVLIGSPNALGALKVAGLLVAGLILIAPRRSLELVKGAFRRAGKHIDSQPPPTPPCMKGEPQPVPERSEPIEPPSKSGGAVASRQELKQVAEEVWKKYGKSDSLVTVDGWRLPPIEILEKTTEIEFSQADNARRARLIEEALASYGVEAKVVQINTGPTVTQFGVEPGWDRKTREVRKRDANGNVKVEVEEVSRTRVKVERIISLANDLAMSLAAPSIRIEAPVPGKSMVGIEVPNSVMSSVSLRGVIETSPFQKMVGKSKLTVALGKASGGEAVVGDLSKMPHLLIAGATGSGKTVCLNALVSCLLMNNAPTELRFIMVDPKRVELTPYNSIPHLASPVIVDPTKAVGALRWLSQEMDRRYETFAKSSARNIEGYNKNREGTQKLPYLVVIIDELADLMMAGYEEVERLLCRLAQLARATGIHLVVATQRPSVDVVTGLIKANFPTRISFAVTSQVDSRTILDMVGAEKLLGKGDMLYMPTEAAKPKRLQGCFLSDPEIERLVYFWNSQQAERQPSLRLEDMVPPNVPAEKEGTPEDPLLETARQLKDEYKQVSASFLQRKLRIGYPRAARLMELLEEGEGGEGNPGINS